MSNTKNEVMLGGFIVVAGGLLAYMSIAVGGFNLQSGIHVKAKFSNASGLVKDAAVTVAGVEVGHVENLAVDHDKAVVTMFIRNDANLRTDVHAMIRAKSLLGEKYMELMPKSLDAAPLRDGDFIRDTRSTVEVDELLASLGPLMKEVNPKDVSIIIHGLAKTIEEEQGSLSKVVHNAGEISDDVRTLIAKNRGNIDQMAANLAGLSKTGNSLLTAKRAEIERAVTNVDKLTGVWRAESPALAAKAQRIAQNVDRLTAAVEPRQVARIATNADAALAKLPPVMDEFKGLRAGIDKTMNKVNPLLDKANSIDEGDVKALASDILLRGGLRVYMHPFQPPETSFMKAPVPLATVKP